MAQEMLKFCEGINLDYFEGDSEVFATAMRADTTPSKLSKTDKTCVKRKAKKR